MLDADEWIEQGGESLRAFALGPPALGVVCVRSEYGQGGQVAQDISYLIRLLPRGVYYEGRIHEQAVSTLARVRMGDWQESTDFFFTLGNWWLDWSAAHPELARQQGLPMAELAWKRCLEIGERPELDGSVHGRGSFLAEHNLAVIRGHGLPRC